VEIDSECGGQGTCGMDIVRIEEGLECLTKMTDVEMRFLEQGKLKKGLRLTCQARVAKNSNDVKVFIPSSGKYTILTDTIETGVELNPSAFKKDGRILYRTGEDLGAYKGKILGLAIDIGTTTLVMQVVDLLTGENVGNPK
jgi:uncharacterized 2Fe-2S/4Fe-4S cluster protein (DUF4445 family)